MTNTTPPEVTSDAPVAVTQEDRDAAEAALSSAFETVTGRAPEWSNLFGYQEALDEIEERFTALAKPTEPAAGLVGEGWHTPIGGLKEAQRITRDAYRSVEEAKAQNTHIPGNPYDVALSALNSTLGELAGVLSTPKILTALRAQPTPQGELVGEPQNERERRWAEAIMRANMALHLVEPPMRADIDAGLKAAFEWAASRNPVPAEQAERPTEKWPLSAKVWKRAPYAGCPEGEWVLTIEGTIGDTYQVSSHTEPLTTLPEDVPGLPSLYSVQAERVGDGVVEAAKALVSAVEALPVDEMVEEDRSGPVLLGYCMQAQGEWDNVRRAKHELSEILASLPARQSEGEVENWRPIETAPKDGTPILLFSPDAREPQVMIGDWCEFTEVGNDRVVAAEWSDLWTESAIDADPTHWRPLPEPPRAALNNQTQGAGE